MLKRPKYKYFFAFSDFLVLLFSSVFSLYLVFWSHGIHGSLNLFLNIIPLEILLFGLMILIFHVNQLYDFNIILKRRRHILRVLKIVPVFVISAFVAFILTNSYSLKYAGEFLASFTLSFFISTYLLRIETFRYLFLKFNADLFKKNLIIIGNGRFGTTLASRAIYKEILGLSVVGFVNYKNKITPYTNLYGKRLLGDLSEIDEIVKNNQVDEIIIALDDISYEELLDIIDSCKSLKISVKLATDLFGIIPKRVPTEYYAGVPVIGGTPPVDTKIYSIIKRTMDISIAIFGVILFIPHFLVIGLIIKITSPGPVIFKQTRIGKNGKPFSFYKFRSMYVSNSEDVERMKQMVEFMNGNHKDNDTKVINNKRVTWIGQFIRRTSLDELPQLFNVIKGEMSLVGPRPSLPYEFENYDSWQKRRVDVMPGCTGVWQVAGRSAVSFKDSVVMDLFYINNISPWLDLKIIFSTVPVMLFSKGGK